MGGVHHGRVYGFGSSGRQLLLGESSTSRTQPPTMMDTDAIFQCQSFQDLLRTQLQQVQEQHDQQIKDMQEQHKKLLEENAQLKELFQNQMEEMRLQQQSRLDSIQRMHQSQYLELCTRLGVNPISGNGQENHEEHETSEDDG